MGKVYVGDFGHGDNERILYVAYGSNMHHEQMARRCPDAVFIGKGVIRGWRFVIRTFADIEPCDGYEVPAAVWSVTRNDVAALDSYEGYPRLYTKVNVMVDTQLGAMECMVYVMCEAYSRSRSSATPQYQQTIIQGYVNCGWSRDDAAWRILNDAVDVANSEVRQMLEYYAEGVRK